jgi:exonuclease SbcD
MADCHLGAYRDNTLRELNLKAFLDSLDKCISEKVDFILIAGDLLDNNLPDSRILNDAVRKLREVRQKGIGIYVVYGSHDYSPSKTSMIDILHSAGLFTKVGGDDVENPSLDFAVDEKTGAKIIGMSAKRLGLEAKQMALLDFSGIEKESGFKIFMFHSAIAECNPEFASFADSLSAEKLPRNFSYYATGHVHTRSFGEKNKRIIGFPGPTFGSDYRDLESTARGEKKGFFIVDFDGNELVDCKFCETDSPKVSFVEYDASGKTSIKAAAEIESLASSVDSKGRIILFRIFGELASGKQSDIDFSRIKDMVIQNGSISVYINRNSLTAKEQEEIRASGETREEIESNVFRSCLENFKSDNKELVDKSHQLSMELLRILKEEQKGGTRSDHEKKIIENSLRLIGI